VIRFALNVFDKLSIIGIINCFKLDVEPKFNVKFKFKFGIEFG